AFSHLIEMIKKKNETNEDFESTELFIGWALFSWHRMLTQYSEDEFKIDAHVILEALFNELTHDMGTDAIVMDVDPIPSSFLEFPEYFNNLSYTYSIHDNFVRYKWQIFVKISIILFKNSMVWTDSQSFIFHKFTPLYLTRKIDDVSASRMFSLWLCHAKCTGKCGEGL
uniref:Glyco_transf_64 domain-containing protein n=1 Tax=Bursaphelenchus xylophilus TaxID=6326 RepID=A0A1I7SJS1_BURXY